MEASEKKKKSTKIKLKNTIYFIVIIIIILSIVILYDKYFLKNRVYATEDLNVKEIKISKAEIIDIEKFLPEIHNTKNKEIYAINEVELEYITKYINNPNLPKDSIQVIQEGRKGRQEVTIKKTYENERLIKQEQISLKIIKSSIDKIVEIGTGKNITTYKAKVGDILLVTSDRLPVMSEKDEDSIKLATLERKDKLKLLEIHKDWYKISSKDIIGYVKAESTITENRTEGTKNEKIKTKEELISSLNFNIELNKPSGLTLEQFKKVLTDSKDKNKIFEQNSEYFYYIEKQYNINGIFVASIGIHESAWGTSQIAINKKNLFGYGAYDLNPYNGAYNFLNYSESIDLLARVLVKYYINQNGTSIYKNEKAIGTYYIGSTLKDVNKSYASDKQWANKVYNYMKYLYNKL